MSLNDYWRIFRRNAWVLLAVPVIAAVSGFVLAVGGMALELARAARVAWRLEHRGLAIGLFVGVVASAVFSIGHDVFHHRHLWIGYALAFQLRCPLQKGGLA